jgi:hypothetical protein
MTTLNTPVQYKKVKIAQNTIFITSSRLNNLLAKNKKINKMEMRDIQDFIAKNIENSFNSLNIMDFSRWMIKSVLIQLCIERIISKIDKEHVIESDKLSDIMRYEIIEEFTDSISKLFGDNSNLAKDPIRKLFSTFKFTLKSESSDYNNFIEKFQIVFPNKLKFAKIDEAQNDWRLAKLLSNIKDAVFSSQEEAKPEQIVENVQHATDNGNIRIKNERTASGRRQIRMSNIDIPAGVSVSNVFSKKGPIISGGGIVQINGEVYIDGKPSEIPNDLPKLIGKLGKVKMNGQSTTIEVGGKIIDLSPGSVTMAGKYVFIDGIPKYELC